MILKTFYYLIILLPYASTCQSGCCDLHDFCPFWAATNECFRNPDWMAANCLFSCNTCGLNSNSENSGSGSPPGSAPTADFVSPDQSRSAIEPAPAAQGSAPVEPAPATRESAPSAVAVAPEEQQITETTTTTRLTTRKAPPDLACSTENTSSRRIITSLDLANSKSSSNCVPQQNAGSSCDADSCFNKRYRSADGFCNNPSNAISGASATPFRRLRPAHTDDGSSSSTRRPSPRDASRLLLTTTRESTDGRFNMLVMQFGQFLTHDVSKNSLLPVTKCGGFGCGTPNEICFPITVNGTDPIFGCQADRCCLPFARAAPVCGGQLGEKLNENTAFIDGSVIYGSSFTDMDHLLDHENGHLRRTLFNGQAFPPFSEQACAGNGNENCIFETGDNRIGLFTGLTALQTVFFREHNRLAEGLAKVNPHWDAQSLFMEARKIVGAQMQVIAYRDWLPIFLGADLAPYTGYDSGVDPSISVEFAFGAMRVGHALLREKTLHSTSDGRQSVLPTEDDVLRIEKVLFDGGIDTFLNGLMGMSIKRAQFLSPSITERIFGGMDLGAINIQRARDAAASSYNEARSLCSLSKASTFGDLSSEISNPETRFVMEKLYKSPDDIDLYVGLLSEDPSSGLVGPTSACLIGDQFKRLRDGDRFFFKNVGIFTNAQLIEIEKAGLSKIICDNADRISSIGTDAFSLSSSQVSCDRLPTIDLTKWAE